MCIEFHKLLPQCVFVEPAAARRMQFRELVSKGVHAEPAIVIIMLRHAIPCHGMRMLARIILPVTMIMIILTRFVVDRALVYGLQCYQLDHFFFFFLIMFF